MNIGKGIEELVTRTAPHAIYSYINKNGRVIGKSIYNGATALSKELIKITFK